MSDWDEDSGYYCLMIAIFCDVGVADAKLIYKYGPDHPLCKKILGKKRKREGKENIGKEAMGNAMYRMQKEGHTLEEISEAFDCYPSTVKRRIKKQKKKEGMYDRPEDDRSNF